MELLPIFKKAYWSLAFFGLIYVLTLFALTFPTPQRHALYVHKVNPTFWQDVNDVEKFGFLKHQVQPFYLKTPDNETLYAWHILPLHEYNQHSTSLAQEHSGPADDHHQTPAFKFLAANPHARVIVSFHGNAGHLVSSLRRHTLSNLLTTSTPAHPTHVFALDYRGFGLSTGFPTETGLKTDALALLDHIIHDLGVPPSRIILQGQSLGSVVAAAVAEHYAVEKKQSFAGVVLVAGFSSLPRLLDTYSVKGVAPPILAPLRAYPRIQKYFRSHILDHWDAASRVARVAELAVAGAGGGGSSSGDDDDPLLNGPGTDISILHARDDWEIPWREGKAVFDAAVAAAAARGKTGDGDGDVEFSGAGFTTTTTTTTTTKTNETEVVEIKALVGGGGRIIRKNPLRISWEKVAYGGHNGVATFQVLIREIMRAFEKLDPPESKDDDDDDISFFLD